MLLLLLSELSSLRSWQGRRELRRLAEAVGDPAKRAAREKKPSALDALPRIPYVVLSMCDSAASRCLYLMCRPTPAAVCQWLTSLSVLGFLESASSLVSRGALPAAALGRACGGGLASTAARRRMGHVVFGETPNVRTITVTGPLKSLQGGQTPRSHRPKVSSVRNRSIYVYTHMCIRIHTYMYVYTHIYTHICVGVHIGSMAYAVFMYLMCLFIALFVF